TRRQLGHHDRGEQGGSHRGTAGAQGQVFRLDNSPAGSVDGNPEQYVEALPRAGPDPSAHEIRFTVKPQEAPELDVLTFSFPDVAADSTTLLLRWGTTAVPLHIEVTPSNAVAPTG